MARQDFEKNGYALIDTSKFDISIPALSKALSEWLRDCEFDNLQLSDKVDNLVDLVSLVHASEQNNEVTARIYQVLPTVPIVYQFLTQQQIMRLLSEHGIRKPTLGTVPLIRIDRPGDTKYSTPWHQDKWFSLSSVHSVVLWAPMGPIEPSMGYLQVIPGSHKGGMVNFKKRATGREPYEPVDAPDEGQSIPVQMKYGEAIIFHQDLLHRSNMNTSVRCRVSLQLRFNDMYRQPYPHSSFTAQHSEHVVQHQRKYLQDDGR